MSDESLEVSSPAAGQPPTNWRHAPGVPTVTSGAPQVPRFADPSFQNRFIPGLSDEAYHADKTAVSSTGVRLAIESPRAFYRGVCLGKKKPATKAMNFGKAAHIALLEPRLFMARYKVMPDFGSMVSSTNRAKRDHWQLSQPEGSEFLKQDEYDDLQEMIQAVQNYRDPRTGLYTFVEILKDSAFEQSGYFRDPRTGLLCKIRPDILRVGATVMPDLKTARKVDRRSFSNAIWDSRYDVQLAFYRLGVKVITGVTIDVPLFGVVQNCEPFDVAVYPLDTGALDRGEREMRVGLNRIAEGVEKGIWPGVQSGGPEDLGLPAYTDFVEVVQ